MMEEKKQQDMEQTEELTDQELEGAAGGGKLDLDLFIGNIPPSPYTPKR